MTYSQEYDEYRAAVAQACVELMHGHCNDEDGKPMSDGKIRYFFGVVCSYEDEFKEGLKPEEVAQAQWEAIT
jgi:hypothetical protein